jgi:hypothetical protein
LVVIGRFGDDGPLVVVVVVVVVVGFLTVLPLLQVDEPELESFDFLGAGTGLDLVLGVRVTGLADAEVGVGGAVTGAVGVGLLHAATRGFFAFLLLIFSSSSEEGHGDTESRPLEPLAGLCCLCFAAAATFLLCTELALNEGARFRDCGLSRPPPQNESERRMRWMRGSGGSICWSEEEDMLDRVDARWSFAGREKRVLSDDDEAE